VILELVAQAQASGVRLGSACGVIGISARTIERWRADPQASDRRCGPQHRPGNALSRAEEAQVVAVLTSSRYAGLSPKQLVPQLADEGLYLASESTMYRVQRRHGLRTQRSATARTHVTRASTMHQATGPNQVWSWDITWLPTTLRGAYLYLYLILDVWSRRIVGWHIAAHESADVAAALITRACSEGNVALPVDGSCTNACAEPTQNAGAARRAIGSLSALLRSTLNALRRRDNYLDTHRRYKPLPM
jgi:hypothetical protein